MEEIEGSEEESEIRNLAAQTKGLEFWNNEKEDIYQDYLSKPNHQKKEEE